MPPIASIAVALALVVLFARGIEARSERLGVALDKSLAGARRDGSTSYRTQIVTDHDPRAPRLLALASRAQAWLAVMGLLRLGTLPMELVDLVDPPHRHAGLVPADDRLVLAHLALGAAVIGASLAALVGRAWIGRLELVTLTPSELAGGPLRWVAAGTAVGAVAAGATAAAVMTWTPMTLYWLDSIAGQSIVYACCAALATGLTLLASRAVVRLRALER